MNVGPFQIDHRSAKAVAKTNFAKFNDGEHLMVAIPDGHSTITVRTSDGKQITFAFCPYQENGTPRCIDILHHTGPAISKDEVGDRLGDEQKVGQPRQKVICFSGGGPDPFRSESNQAEKKPVTLVTLLLE